MVEVKEKRISDGYDCWGRPEYDYVYVVLDENGNEIFRSKNDPTKLINMFINKNSSCFDKDTSASNAIDQIKWERDVAISQLEELGLRLGQKVDGVYLTYDKYNELLEYKYMYEDLCK